MFPILPTKVYKSNTSTKRHIYDRYIPNRATSKTPDDVPFAPIPLIRSSYHQMLYQQVNPGVYNPTFRFSSEKKATYFIPYRMPKRITLSQEKVLDAPNIGLEDDDTHPIAWSASGLAMLASNPPDGGEIYTTPLAPTPNQASALTISSPVLNTSVHAIAALGSHHVVSSWKDGCIRVHDLKGRDQENLDYTQTIGTGNIPLHAFTLTGPKTLVAGNAKGHILLFDLRTSEGVTNRNHTTPDCPSQITSLAYNGLGLIASGSRNHHVEIQDLRKLTSLPLHAHTNHTGTVRALTFQNNGLTTVGGGACHSICRWDFDTTNTIKTHRTSAPITGVHYLSNSDYMVTSHGSGDPSLQVWHVTSNNLTQIYHHAFRQDDNTLALLKAPDDTDRLAVGLAKETFCFFKTHGMKPKIKKQEHTSCLTPSWQSIR
jgi:WD40 repeat protein